MSSPIYLAMWSGPRNISTAMMRSWGNRTDTHVCDEPLYAHYLDFTRKEHPGKTEVIAGASTDWRQVVAELTGPIPEGKRVFFQKHMTHHMLPHIGRDWLSKLANCFLIRHPRDMLLSYTKIIAAPTFEDTGFPQQRELFEWVRQHLGITPPVLDSRDVQNHPREVLGQLCDALQVEFQESMLRWAPGLRTTDGVWAKHWYKEVETSTEFRPYQERNGTLPAEMLPLYEQCLACYEVLHPHRIRG